MTLQIRYNFDRYFHFLTVNLKAGSPPPLMISLGCSLVVSIFRSVTVACHQINHMTSSTLQKWQRKGALWHHSDHLRECKYLHGPSTGTTSPLRCTPIRPYTQPTSVPQHLRCISFWTSISATSRLDLFSLLHEETTRQEPLQ
jgi:hypothetical protein